MTRVQAIAAVIWLLVLLGLAEWLLLPRSYQQLQQAAQRVVAPLPTGYQPVQLNWQRNQVTVQGRVRTEAQRDEILHALRTQVRTASWPGCYWNPVESVRDALQVQPYPVGWLLLTCVGGKAQLVGHVATLEEAQELHEQMQRPWLKLGRTLPTDLTAVPELHDPCPELGPSLTQPLESGNLEQLQNQALIYWTRLGQRWQQLPAEKSDAELVQQTQTWGLDEITWAQYLQPALASARAFTKEKQDYEEKRHAYQLAQEVERLEHAKLRPPHLFLALRDQRLLVRGEVGSMKQKREFLNTLIQQFPSVKVLDDVRLNSQCQSQSSFPSLPPLFQALAQAPAEESLRPPQLHFATPGSSHWLVLPQETEPQLTGPVLWPLESVAPERVRDDLQMVQDWLISSARGIPKLPVRAQPTFITLSLHPGGHAVFSGQVADESLRVQLAELAQEKYGLSVQAESLLIRKSCAAWPDPALTPLPDLPATGCAGVLAFLTPGQGWRAATYIEPADFPTVKAQLLQAYLPPQIPQIMVDTCLQDSFQQPGNVPFLNTVDADDVRVPLRR
jgi:hypothetical protein